MRKRSKPLTLHFESLRILEAARLAGADIATQANTCPTSCAPTCGNPPGSPGARQAAISRAACCV